MGTSVITLSGRHAQIDETALDGFRRAFRGKVIRAGEPGDTDKPIFNAMHRRRPALIARCEGTQDVVHALKFAREHDLLVAVRGGGHSIAGHSSCDGGMVIDLTSMRGVAVNPDAKVVRVQGGALWADVDREAQPFGLVVPGGVVSETGVAGLTLGGGEGWVRRKYGLTVDSLLSAEVVCADGTVRIASPASEPDLSGQSAAVAATSASSPPSSSAPIRSVRSWHLPASSTRSPTRFGSYRGGATTV